MQVQCYRVAILFELWNWSCKLLFKSWQRATKVDNVPRRNYGETSALSRSTTRRTGHWAKATVHRGLQQKHGFCWRADNKAIFVVFFQKPLVLILIPRSPSMIQA